MRDQTTHSGVEKLLTVSAKKSLLVSKREPLGGTKFSSVRAARYLPVSKPDSRGDQIMVPAARREG